MELKKFFIMIMVAMTGILSSCEYDDDEVWDSVNDLADRVTTLETATKQLNSDIAALQSVVSALQNQLSVSKVETLEDGYIIHFSDGTKATIKNGADGKDGADGADGENGKDGVDGKDGLNAPVINVKKEGDVFYWTITVDGVTEWLTDGEGNKLAVSGIDGENGSTGATGPAGADGKTPLLKVDADGYWMVSYDNGTSYNRVKDANNNDVKAKGENGDSQFQSIVKDDTNGIVVIKLVNGDEYKLPMLAAVTYTGAGISGNELTLTAGSTATLTYAVPALGSKYSVEVLKTDKVEVTLNEAKKELNIKATGPSGDKGKAVVLYYNANQTITSSLIVTIQ